MSRDRHPVEQVEQVEQLELMVEPQRFKISVCCTTVICIFSLLGGPPLVSRQVGFLAGFLSQLALF